jgi:alkylhydroperoxidase family enzyme
MAWIKTIKFTEADALLRKALEGQSKLYPAEYRRDPTDDGSTSIVATHTLIPDALFHAFGAFGSLLSPDLPLTRAQHEMIATRVSALNRCHY